MSLRFFILLFLPAISGAEEIRKDRLSWGQLEFLQRGYRNAPWVNDPFFPDGKGFRLMGIVSGEMAFINGKWVRIGEVVDGYKVQSIAASGVTLVRKADIIRLKVKE